MADLGPSIGSVNLVERAAVTKTALDYLGEAAAGHGRLLFVAGEAGVGKTTYVSEVIAAAGPAATVAVGACDGSSTPPPLGPLVEMLLRRALADEGRMPAHAEPIPRRGRPRASR